MRKRNKLQPAGSTSENIILIFITLIAAVVVCVVHAPDKWLAAIYETVCTFGAMIFFFRVRWRYSRFWIIVVVAFSVHLALTWLVFALMLQNRLDVSLVYCIPFIFLEAAALYYSIRILEPTLPGQGNRAAKKGF